MIQKSPELIHGLPPSLFGGGHSELGPLLNAVGPALYDAFLPGVEAHPFLTVDVHVAEQALLLAAETMTSQKSWLLHITGDIYK